jgi:glycosyltransferase involved in cell wall biosynthesis
VAKRILIFTNHFFPENFKVNEIAQLLAEEGNNVHVVTGIPNYPTGKIFEGYGFFKKSFEKKGDYLTIRRLPLIPRGNGSRFRLIVNYISYFLSALLYTFFLIFFKKKYDLVFVHHTSPVFVAIPPIFYKWAKGSKNILWDLDMWPDTLCAVGIIKSQRLTYLLEVGMKWIYSCYDQILLGSEGFLEKAKFRVSQSKVHYFPNWAESDLIKAPLNDPNSGFNFPASFTVSYTGNIGEAQDFSSVYKAMVNLKDYDINWLIVGDGRFKSKLEEDVIRAGLQDKVFFLGNRPISQIPTIFNQSDILFLSLKNEEIFKLTVPAKLQAYMASGKPVAAMLSGEGARIIRDSKCGFVVDSGDYKGFASSILSLYQKSKIDRENLGKNGKEFYLRNFDFKLRKTQLKKLLD